MYKDMLSYRKAWDNAYKVDPPIPLNIDLEIASLCNLRCPFCFIPDPKFEEFISQKSDDGKSLRRIMPTELAFKIIDQAAEIGIPALKMNWRGESTIAPNYSEIVEYAASQRIVTEDFCLKTSTKESDFRSTGIMNIVKESENDVWSKTSPIFLEILANTNANCPDKAIDGLMATTKCMVSLDSMVPETYAKMRVGGKLERAKEVISELVRRRHPNLWVRRVLTKLNYKEPFFEQVKEEWGEKVKVSEHACFDRNEKQDNEISGCDHDELQRTYCMYPSQRIIITSAGFAYPCCLDLKESMRVGDINKQSILEIWNGTPMKQLRKELKSNIFKSKECQNCQSWMAYKAPQREFVQDRENIKIEIS